MADYNIYIHDATTRGSTENQATAWKPGEQSTSQTKAWTPSSEKQDGNIFSSIKAMGQGIKSSPVIAAIAATVTFTNKIADFVIPIVSKYSGNYDNSLKWENYKAGMSFVNPFNILTSLVNYRMETELYNKKQDQYQTLLGDSIVNIRSRRY